MQRLTACQKAALMFDALAETLPFIAIAICLVAIALDQHKKKNADEKKPPNKKGQNKNE